MRQRLTITEVLEPRTIGDKNIPLQEFNANGKKYSVFSKSLFPYIKLNTEIDAEVEVKEGENWTNYKVIDIFVNGQSVKGQQQSGYRGKSPEELDLSRRSYALAYAKDLAVADKIEVKDILDKATEFSDWLKPTATAVNPTPKQEASVEGTAEEPSSRFGTKPITQALMKKIMDLNQAHPGRPAQLIKEWGWDAKDVTQLTRDQAKHLIEVLEKVAKTEEPEIEQEDLPFE